MFHEPHPALFNGMASGSVACKTAQSMEACACVRKIGILVRCRINAYSRIDLFTHVHLLADTPICRCLLGFLFPEATCANSPVSPMHTKHRLNNNIVLQKKCLQE